MSILREWIVRLWGNFRIKRSDADIEQELRAHLELADEELRRRGLPEADARRSAYVQLGGIPQAMEAIRDQRGFAGLDELRQDLRYGGRALLRNKSFAVVAVLALALGVGLNSAMFSLADGLFLRVTAPGSGTLVRLYGVGERGNAADVFSYPDYVDLRDGNRSFASLAALVGTTVGVRTGENSEDVPAELVSGNYFSVFQVVPLAGRLLTPADDVIDHPAPVVVVSEAFWKNRLGGVSNIVGRSIIVNGSTFEIIGVVRDSFRGSFGAFASSLWFPLATYRQVRPGDPLITDRGWGWLRGTGRLKSGVSIAQATADVQHIAALIAQDNPRPGTKSSFQVIAAGNLPDEMRSDASMLFLFIMMAAGAVLLTTCANIAGMTQARTMARQREVAVRQSLGAGRFRLIRQWVTESLLLSAIGGGSGFLLALWLKGVFLRLAPPDWGPVAPDVSIDWRVVVFTLSLTVLSGLLFGVAPAVCAGRVAACDGLKTGAALAFRHSRFHGVAVGVQVAISLVLLIVSGLMFRSLRISDSFNPGFTTNNLVVAQLDLRRNGYPKAAQQEFYLRLLQSLKTAPGIVEATHAMVVPLGEDTESSGYVIEGNQPPDGRSSFSVENDIVGSDYFETLGLPIVAGRNFAPKLSAAAGPTEGIVNEAFAKRFWPEQNPIGKMIGLKALTIRVVGVVRTIPYHDLGEKPLPFVYLSAQQTPPHEVNVLVRTSGEPEAAVSIVRQAIRTLDPNVSTDHVLTFHTLRRGPLFLSRALLAVAASFGVLALILTVIGIYGVISYSVARRTREFGIRIALGARRSQVCQLVVGEGLRLTAFGVAAGVGASVLCTRFLATLLFGITATDPLTFGVIVLLVISTAGLACYLPARRATRVSPVEALRQDG